MHCLSIHHYLRAGGQFLHALVNGLGRGVTIYTGGRGVGKRGESANCDIVYSVITRLEINRLKAEGGGTR